MNLTPEKIAEIAQKIRIQLEEEQDAEIQEIFSGSMPMTDIVMKLNEITQKFSMRFTVLLLQTMYALSDSDEQ